MCDNTDMWSADELGNALRLGSVPDDELTMVLSDILPRGAQFQHNQVEYRTNEDETALTLSYKDGRIVSARPGPALTLELQDKISEQIQQILLDDSPTIILRSILFSGLPIEGHWRYQDEFQLVPVPPDAPRPGVLIADHPFVLECRIVGSTSWSIVQRRLAKRVREIALILNLITRYGVKSITAMHSHHWTLTFDENMKSTTRWSQEGYWIDGFDVRADDWTPEESSASLTQFEPGAYYGGWPPATDTATLPTCVSELFATFFSLDEASQQTFLRAAYWYRTASEIWRESQSLHLVSLINAIEVLAGSGAIRRQRDAPTQQFLDFMTRYAPANPSQRRLNDIYDARGQISHGSRLLGYDENPLAPGLDQQSMIDRGVGTTQVGYVEELCVTGCGPLPGPENHNCRRRAFHQGNRRSPGRRVQ
jgi:hypothetical protein